MYEFDCYHFDPEMLKAIMDSQRWEHRITTSQAPNPAMQVPALISKKWLIVRFDLMHNGRYKVPMLYEKVLTPEVLAAIGLTEAQVRRPSFKRFDALASARLKKILML